MRAQRGLVGNVLAVRDISTSVSCCLFDFFMWGFVVFSTVLLCLVFCVFLSFFLFNFFFLFPF